MEKNTALMQDLSEKIEEIGKLNSANLQLEEEVESMSNLSQNYALAAVEKVVSEAHRFPQKQKQAGEEEASPPAAFSLQPNPLRQNYEELLVHPKH